MDIAVEKRIETLPGFLTKDRLQFIMFGGKGGVGKTTSATSTARFLARKHPDKKILVFSTDPAHSLSDSLAQEIGDEPTLIKGFDNLYSVEMNFHKIYDRFVREYEFELVELAERSTYFGITQMSNAAATLSYSTSFEFMVTILLIELSKFENFDKVVIDTAPTGHTLKLLELLAGIQDQFRAMERSQARHQYMKQRLMCGNYVKDSVDKFLDMMKSEVARLQNILTGLKTEFVAVTIAEEMAVWETKRLLRALRKREYQIPNQNIIVNGLSYSTLCPLCSSRKKEGESYLQEIAQEFPDHNIIRIPLFPYEIRGEGLDEYGAFLQGKHPPSVPLQWDLQGKGVSVSDKLAEIYPVGSGISNEDKMDDLLNKKSRSFLIFGGKGGVGKTTSAAATAVHIAGTNPDKKVLVFSTDPAHSLSDSFDIPAANRETLIEGFNNLWAHQINLEEKFLEFKSNYRKMVREAFRPRIKTKEGGGAGKTDSAMMHPYDKETVLNLVSLSPLGLDESLAVADALLKGSRNYDVIIIDTAPTGHLVKLLERPELVLRWFSNIIQGMKHYSGMMSTTFDVTRALLDTRKEIVKSFKILTNSEETEFVVVTIAEFMGIYETERLVKDLESLKVASRYIIANKILPPGKCPFCNAKRSQQLRYIEEIHNKFPLFQIVETPLCPHEVRGVDSLMEFSRYMYRGDRGQRTEIRGQRTSEHWSEATWVKDRAVSI